MEIWGVQIPIDYVVVGGAVLIGVAVIEMSRRYRLWIQGLALGLAKLSFNRAIDRTHDEAKKRIYEGESLDQVFEATWEANVNIVDRSTQIYERILSWLNIFTTFRNYSGAPSDRAQSCEHRFLLCLVSF